jgi:protein-disulfide isomerase
MRALLPIAALLCLTLIAPAAAEDAQTVDTKLLMAAGPLAEKTLGDPNAPVTIVEYASLTCPHCGKFHRTVFPTLKSKYIDTGKVYFVLREFPLDQLALAAAMVARCAPESDYFAVIDAMFIEQDDWAYVDNPGKALLDLVAPYGFTDASFRACLGDDKLVQNIVAVEKGGDGFGVKGTPAFFINGTLHGGEMTVEQIDAALAPLLGAGQP